MVRYPPAILAPPGVARLQACVITRSPALTSCARAGAAIRHARSAAEAKLRANGFIGCSLACGLLLFPPVPCSYCTRWLSVGGLEGVFPGENVGSPRERMEQEVLLVEEVIDPEIEREILRRVVMDLHVRDDVFVERAVDM